MVLVDTSVWIDYFNRADTRQVRAFDALIEDSEDICVCGVVVTEILQGIRSERQFEKVQSILDDLIYLETGKDTHILAAAIYRGCRRRGYTVRKPVDCIIAACCIQHSVFILHNDKDFEYISKMFPLQKV
jgi:hypothetical protein